MVYLAHKKRENRKYERICSSHIIIDGGVGAAGADIQLYGGARQKRALGSFRGAGLLFAIWLGKTNSSLLGNFTKKDGILGTAADFAFTAVMTGLAYYALCSVMGGFIRPLMKSGKPNNPMWRMLLYVLCTALGIALLGYFLYISAAHLVRGGGSAGDVVMIATGIVYLLSGVMGIAQWRGRKRRIARAKEKETGKPAA